VVMIFLQQEFVIAQQRFPWSVCQQKPLGEKGPGYPIHVGNFRPFPVDTVMQPGEHDNMDTGLRISSWASDTLHRMASGGWWMVMNLKDS
jgi:hypothetical protein